MSRKSIFRIVVAAIAVFFIFSSVGFAQDSYDEDMVVPDVVVGRPMGLIALGIGSIVYVVTLPFSVIAGPGGTERACDALVKRPYQWTFKRPLGADLDAASR